MADGETLKTVTKRRKNNEVGCDSDNGDGTVDDHKQDINDLRALLGYKAKPEQDREPPCIEEGDDDDDDRHQGEGDDHQGPRMGRRDDE